MIRKNYNIIQDGINGCQKFNEDKNKSLKEIDERSRKERNFNCEKCGKEFSKNLTDKEYKNYLKNHPKYFCSLECAKAHIQSESTKLKISQTLSNKNHNYKKRICKKCGNEYVFNKKINPEATKTFCSKECRKYYRSHLKEFLSEEIITKFQEGGKKGAAIQREIRILFYPTIRLQFYGMENGITKK